jgi:hypothetical protein
MRRMIQSMAVANLLSTMPAFAQEVDGNDPDVPKGDKITCNPRNGTAASSCNGSRMLSQLCIAIYFAFRIMTE